MDILNKENSHTLLLKDIKRYMKGEKLHAISL